MTCQKVRDTSPEEASCGRLCAEAVRRRFDDVVMTSRTDTSCWEDGKPPISGGRTRSRLRITCRNRIHCNANDECFSLDNPQGREHRSSFNHFDKVQLLRHCTCLTVVTLYKIQSAQRRPQSQVGSLSIRQDTPRLHPSSRPQLWLVAMSSQIVSAWLS